MTTKETCADKVQDAFNSRMADIRKMYMAEGRKADLGDGYPIPLHEYGLAIDYVQANTFEGQHYGYWRYQLSWGGPSEEFRWYRSNGGARQNKVEFWYLDWFDGAHIEVQGVDAEIIRAIIKGE